MTVQPFERFHPSRAAGSRADLGPLSCLGPETVLLAALRQLLELYLKSLYALPGIVGVSPITDPLDTWLNWRKVEVTIGVNLLKKGG